MRSCAERLCRRGLTLVEVSVSTLLVGLILVAGLKSTGAVIHGRDNIAAKLDSVGLAHELLSEIVALPYEDPDEELPTIGLDTGEGLTPNLRSDYDDIDDYDSWSAIPPRHRGSAAPRNDFTGWQRDVQVDYMDPNAPTTTSLTDQDLKRITVTVTDPSSNTYTVSALRSRSGMLEQAPPQDITAVTWAGIELEVGAGTGKVVHGSELPNHAEDE